MTLESVKKQMEEVKKVEKTDMREKARKLDAKRPKEERPTEKKKPVVVEESDDEEEVGAGESSDEEEAPPARKAS